MACGARMKRRGFLGTLLALPAVALEPPGQYAAELSGPPVDAASPLAQAGATFGVFSGSLEVVSWTRKSANDEWDITRRNFRLS